MTLATLAFAGLLMGAPAAERLQDFILRATAALPESPPVRSLDQAAIASDRAISANLAEAPWSIRSSLAHAQYLPRRTEAQPEPYWDTRAFAEIRYALRSRLIASLAGSVALAESGMFDAGEPTLTPFSVELALSYDVLRGSTNSSENNRARAAAVRALASKLDSESRIVTAELVYASLLARIFANACKLHTLDELSRTVAQSLAEAKLQLDTKVMSQPQFMNYQHLDNLVRAQRADLDLDRAALLEELHAWGEAAHAIAAKLYEQPIACAPAEAPESAAPATADAIQLAQQLPAHAAAVAAEWAAALDLAATHTERSPGLAPYVLARGSRAAGADRAFIAGELGLAFDWDVAGTKGDLLEQTALELHAAATRRVEETLAAESAAIRRLQSDASRAAAPIAALAATIANTDKLTAALEVQRAIGEVDALNQTTAVVNGISAKLALTDAWVRRDLALLQLAALANAARRYAPELERLHRKADLDR